MYWVIHLTKTDDNIMMWPCFDGEEINNYINTMRLHREDYAILEGTKLKSFDNVSFNHTRLKRRS